MADDKPKKYSFSSLQQYRFLNDNIIIIMTAASTELRSKIIERLTLGVSESLGKLLFPFKMMNVYSTKCNWCVIWSDQ